jgi:hypothetical protein
MISSNRSRLPLLFVTALAAMALFVLPLPARTEARVADPGAPETTLARLHAIVDAIDLSRFPYANLERARALHAERLPDDRLDTVVMHNLRIAYHELAGGEAERSLSRLNALRELLDGYGEDVPAGLWKVFWETYGMAALRMGEQKNCLGNHNAESCVLPIQGGGVHLDTMPATVARNCYRRCLEEFDPTSVANRWLLNLSAMAMGDHPGGVPEPYVIEPSMFDAGAPFPIFPDVAPACGVDVMGLSGGSVMDDFDGDGDLDLVASSWGIRDQIRYLRNDDGTFADATRDAGLIGQIGGLNLSHADYDGDGDLDLLVLRGAWLGEWGDMPNSLLRNDGRGVFEDVTIEAGVYREHPCHSAAWGDIDLDGALDLVIANESYPGGERVPAHLFMGDGAGGFRDVAMEAGLDLVGLVKGIALGDVDGDGDLDLYASRYGEPNVLYVQIESAADGSPRFEDRTRAAGVAEPVNSFPTWFFDYDNDGALDLFVGSFGGFEGDNLEPVARDILGLESDGERCRLFRNRGDGTFEDVSERTGVARVLLSMGANFGDLDNDGWLDCIIGTGEPRMSTLVPNVALRNAGGGHFEDVSSSGRFGNLQKGHGVSFGDLDGDGDQDIHVVMGGAYSGDVYPNLLYENPGNENAWVTLRCRATTGHPSAIGARIEVVVTTRDGTRRSVHRVVGTGGSFGASSYQQEIGLGAAARIDAVRVRWPGASEAEVFENVPLGAVVRVEQGTGRAVPIPVQVLELGSAAAAAPEHEHHH